MSNMPHYFMLHAEPSTSQKAAHSQCWPRTHATPWMMQQEHACFTNSKRDGQEELEDFMFETKGHNALAEMKPRQCILAEYPA